MAEILEKHFSGSNFDIRKGSNDNGHSRFMDQKVTPDVLSFICECILNYIGDESDKFFTRKDIEKSSYFIKIVTEIFGKPSPLDQTTKSEYDKFVAQPLKTLAFGKVLTEHKEKGINIYNVNNLEVLKYIAMREFNAFRFIYEYLLKVLKDSGFILVLEAYKQKYLESSLTKNDFQNLKQKYIYFTKAYTNIKKDFEPKRIFPKIVNVYAAENRIPGTVAGRMSKFPFTYSDLIYNRVNFRDTKKSKGESRQTTYQLNPDEFSNSTYRIKKAMDLIRKTYKDSEVKDQWARGSATHVHHIFSKSEFPELAESTENLILITPEQHYSKAHPNSHTDKVNPEYQLVCLLAKIDNIEKSILNGENIYSKDQLIQVVNRGLNINLQSEISFEELRKSVKEAY